MSFNASLFCPKQAMLLTRNNKTSNCFILVLFKCCFVAAKGRKILSQINKFNYFSTHGRHLYFRDILCRFKIDTRSHPYFGTEQVFDFFSEGFAAVFTSDADQYFIRSQFIGINLYNVILDMGMLSRISNKAGG